MLAIILGRTSLLGDLLASLGSFDGGRSDLLSGVGKEVTSEVDGITDDTAQIARSQEERTELLE